MLKEESYQTNELNAREYYAKERYGSASEALREGVANAYAAIQRAVRDGYMNLEDGEIDLIIENDELIIRDNGIGVSADDEENLRTVADSDNAEDPYILATYGIGRFALMKLSKDDEFDFITRSRKDDTTGGVRFTLDRPKNINATREDYGSTVRLTLADKFKNENLGKWALQQFSFLPVPVNVRIEKDYINSSKLSRDLREDDKDFFEETIGQKTLLDTIEDNTHKVIYSTEDVELVFHNSWNTDPEWPLSNHPISARNGVSLYNNMPIQIPSSHNTEKQFSFNIKREDGAEVTGPHGGSVKLPQSTNDRGRLKEDNYTDFVEWAMEIYRYYAHEDLQTVEARNEDVTGILNDPLYDFHSKVASSYGWDDEYVQLVMENKGKKLPYSEGTSRHTTVGRLFREGVPPENVYVGKTINDRRAKVVEDLHEDETYKVLSTRLRRRYGQDKTLSYETARELGFNLLKEVPLDANELEEMGVSDSVINEVADGGTATYTVHWKMERRYRRRKRRGDRSTRSFDSPEEVLENIDADYIILFNETDDENISDHYDDVCRSIGMMNLQSKNQAHKLADGHERFVLAEDINWDVEAPEGKVFHTSVDEENLERVYDDFVVVDELTPSVLVALQDSSIRYFPEHDERPDLPVGVNLKTVNNDNLLVHEVFSDRSEEFRNDMLKLGSDSPVWEELAE